VPFDQPMLITGVPGCYSHDGTKAIDYSTGKFLSPWVVHSASAGVVSVPNWDPGGYGHHLVIQSGSYTFLYAHLQENGIYVDRDDTIQQGTFLGMAGSSGQSTGIHLHFEVKNYGAWVDIVNLGNPTWKDNPTPRPGIPTLGETTGFSIPHPAGRARAPFSQHTLAL
jgi:murein DD-endopeptidase MepM/ murein hydrolase activator NlpD